MAPTNPEAGVRLGRYAFPLLAAAALGVAAGGPVQAAGPSTGQATTVGAPRLVAPAGAPEESAPSLSGDGRRVAYQVRGVTATGAPVLRLVRRDLATGATSVLNRRADGGVAGGVAGGNYSQVVLSASGDRAAFLALRAALVPQDRDTRPDAYVRDAGTGTTTLVSGGDGSAGVVSLSDDGRWAAFTSSGTDLVPGSTLPNSDAYLRDLATGAVRQVSVRADGSPSRGVGTTDVDVDAAGGHVAFLSYATDLGVGDGDDRLDGEPDLFLRDTATGTTSWLSREVPAGAAPSGVTLSPDARWVVTRYADGSLHLLRTSDGRATLLAADASVSRSAFSTDGRLLATTRGGRAYVTDLATGSTVDLRTPAGGTVSSTSLAGDGRSAAYDWQPAGSGPSRVYRVDLTR